MVTVRNSIACRCGRENRMSHIPFKFYRFLPFFTAFHFVAAPQTRHEDFTKTISVLYQFPILSSKGGGSAGQGRAAPGFAHLKILHVKEPRIGRAMDKPKAAQRAERLPKITKDDLM